MLSVLKTLRASPRHDRIIADKKYPRVVRVIVESPHVDLTCTPWVLVKCLPAKLTGTKMSDMRFCWGGRRRKAQWLLNNTTLLRNWCEKRTRTTKVKWNDVKKRVFLLFYTLERRYTPQELTLEINFHLFLVPYELSTRTVCCHVTSSLSDLFGLIRSISGLFSPQFFSLVLNPLFFLFY